MAGKLIGFFSSDARKLYIDDVVKVISYPEGYVVQFRYRKKYIAQYYHDFNRLIGEQSVIVFTTGNILGAEKVNLVHQPVRKAEIINVVDDAQTDRVYFYLKLKEFCQTSSIIPDENKELFVKNVDQTIIESTFIEVVERLNISSYPSLFTILGFYEKVDRKDKTYTKPILPEIIDNKDSAYYLDD
jgi:hypothetical protein